MMGEVIGQEIISFRVFSRCLTKIFAVMAIFFVPLSGYLMTKLLMGAVVMSLFSGDWSLRWKLISSYSSMFITIALIGLLTIGIFYSHGSWHYSLQVYSRYIKLLYFPILLPFFQSKDWRSAGIYSFILGALVAVLTGCVRYFFPNEFSVLGDFDRLFVNFIDAAFLAAVASFLSIHLFFETKRWWLLLIVTVLVGYLFLISKQRTGYLIAFGLAGLACWQQFRIKGLIAAACSLPIVSMVLYLWVPKFSTQINMMISQLLNQAGNEHQPSITLRMGFAKYSWKAIKQHFIFGYGTGSFREVYASTGGPVLEDKLLSHPHNEYILMMFQFGIIGLVLFLGWLFFLWQDSKKLLSNEHKMAQGLILAFAILGVCNASLYVSAAGTGFVVLLAVLFSGLKIQSVK